jgi:DNA modification methylase
MREEVIGGQRLILGDCLEVLPTLAAGSVDVTFADPPYGVGKAAWDDEFAKSWLPLAANTTDDLLCITPGISNLLSLPKTVGRFSYSWTCATWIANGRTRGAVGFGNWMALVIYASGGGCYRCAQDIHRITIDGIMPEHPSPKPHQFMEWFVGTFVKPTQTILDPFMGSGTTLVAAELLGRRGIGIEIDEGYFDVACRRVEEAVRKREAAAAQLTLAEAPA